VLLGAVLHPELSAGRHDGDQQQQEQKEPQGQPADEIKVLLLLGMQM
jgi:hypothetical protein